MRREVKMSKLKTLKEIYGNKANGQISVRELRQEAIKWIKRDTEEDGCMHECAVPEFMKFFNLTEDDLK